jgi:heme exporter protein CcmD
MKYVSFLSMGGYAAYILPAYGLTLALLGIGAYHAYQKRKKTLQQLRLWFLV